jgi:membrane-bound lytic murein transglycosylase B
MLRLIRNICFITLLILSTTLNLAYADTSFVERKDVQDFIQMMVKKYKFKQQDLVTLFSQVKLRPQVIRHINKPLEKEPWRLYQMLLVNEWRIAHGVEFWDKYESTLQQAEKVYGVPASIIVATIGIETRYGQKVGDYRVIDSLSNLAFSTSTRAKFFQKELIEYLLLTREQKLDPLKIMGSYAGAIGQPQFMPSSYRYYAVNFSGSGKTDLMNDEVDVIGSIANYYHLHGWNMNEPVAIQAVLMGNRYRYLTEIGRNNQAYTLADFSKFGVVPKINPNRNDLRAKLIELDNRYSSEYWLGFRNFDVIKRYNQSDLYAMAVYQLSYYIKTLRNRLNKE